MQGPGAQPRWGVRGGVLKCFFFVFKCSETMLNKLYGRFFMSMGGRVGPQSLIRNNPVWVVCMIIRILPIPIFLLLRKKKFRWKNVRNIFLSTLFFAGGSAPRSQILLHRQGVYTLEISLVFVISSWNLPNFCIRANFRHFPINIIEHQKLAIFVEKIHYIKVFLQVLNYFNRINLG